jgi:hypothetical protein
MMTAFLGRSVPRPRQRTNPNTRADPEKIRQQLIVCKRLRYDNLPCSMVSCRRLCKEDANDDRVDKPSFPDTRNR